MQAKVGTLESKYEFFHKWKRLAEEDQSSGKSYSMPFLLHITQASFISSKTTTAASYDLPDTIYQIF